MIENILHTSLAVFLLALSIICLLPNDELPYAAKVGVLCTLALSIVTAFVSVIFLIWAN